MATTHGEHGMIAQRHVDQEPELESKMCVFHTNMEAYPAQRQLQLHRTPKRVSLWIAPVYFPIRYLWYQLNM